MKPDQNFTLKHFALLLTIIVFIVLTGCSDKNPAAPADDTNSAYDESADVAESIAGSIGEETGGLTDQVNDLIALTEEGPMAKTNGDFFDTKEKSWDDATQAWTITLIRERGNEAAAVYAFIERSYKVQFLNKDNQPQQFFITNGDTANTMSFDILSGSGRHKTLKIKQQLLKLEGSFIATGTQTDTVTINGTYARAAVDTITTQNFTRIHNHATELTVTDLKGARGSRRNLSQKYSGIISGSHTAEVHWSGENGQGEKNIYREIYIDISEGETEIMLDNMKYKCNLVTGQVN